MEFTDTKSSPFETATGNLSPQFGVTTVNPLEDTRLAQLASSQAPNSLSTPQDAASLLTGTDSARIFAGTEKADQIRIKAGATAGTITVESLNGTFASVTFAIPTTSLTINSGAGADTITVDSLAGFTAPLTIDDTDDVILNNITVVGNLNVKAGNSIKVVDGVIIASQGDVNLDVTNRVELNFGSAVLKQKQSNAAIDIGNATINGRNVSITTDAATTKTAKLDKNLVYDARATVLGDVNGDGKVDLIVGNYNASSQLYLNNGTVDPFKDVNAITLTGTNKTTSLVLGDVNGDGKLDLILGSDGAPTQLWLNNGSSTTNPFFGITPIDITTQKTVSVVLGDVNGDNKLDLVIGNFQAASQVFLNNGSNNPFSGTAQTFGSSTDATTAVALADVNGDGKLDLIRCQTGQTNSPKFTQLFLNNGTANPFSSTAINIGTGADATKSVALGDVNGDGRIDIILGNNGQPTRLFLNNGTANPFSSTAINIGTGTDTTTSLALADMNGDSKLDLILGNGKEPIRLFLNNGTATPFTGTGVNIDPTAAGNANAIATSDLNGDGKRDLVVVGAAQVPALYLNNGTADPFKDVAAKSITPESDLATQIDESALLQFSLLAAAIKADATATITVGSGAKITGSNNVKLYSNALANAQMTTIGAYLGATYASSTPTATVIIKGDGIKGANIMAGGAFDMKAIVNNTVAVSTYVPDLPTLLSTPSGGFGGDIAFSYAKGISTSIADIQKGATVTALNANVLAKNTNSFENTASAMGFQATGPLGLGVTVVLSDFQSRATTSMNGTISTTQDTTIDAQSIDTKNITRSSASVSAPKQNSDTIRSAAKGAGRGIQSLGGKLIGYGSKLQSTFLGTVGKKTLAGGGKVVNFAQTSGAPSLAVSAAVTFVNSSNTADAFIGEGARVSAGGNVTVNAKAWENPQASATASAGGAETGSIGGAVNIANFTNKANAYIGKNATVDAGATLLVNANAEVARNFQLFELNLSLPSGQPQTNDQNKSITAAWDDGQFTLGKLKTVLFDGLIYPILSTSTTLGNISTTLVHSGGTVEESDGKLKEGGKAGIAGGVNILDINNGATAYIAEGAKINQNLQNPPTTQDVKVNAFAGITTLNVAGQFSTLNLALNQNVGGAGGGATGFGGSVDAITLNNAAKAYIASDAKVSASRDVEVKADTFNYHVTLAQAGSKSDRLGIDGAINFVNLDNQSTAYIDTNATIKTGRNVAVNANDNLLNANGSGSLAIAGNVGIGVSAGINKINTVVRAYIGTDTPPVNSLETARGSVTAGGDISVTANSNQKVVNISLAGAAAPGYQPPVPEDDAVANNIANLFDDSFGSAAQNPVRNKQFGFGLSGDAALNFFTPNVQAYIKNSGTIIAGQKLNINATNNSLLVGTAGAFAIAKDAGIGGSFALNYLDKSTKAYTENVTIQAGNIVTSAISDALVVNISAGAAGSAQKASIAGSVNLGLLRNDTQAYLGSNTKATVTKGGVLIDAKNTLTTWSIAGVVSGTLQGKAAVGAAIDLGIIDATVKAFIANNVTLSSIGDIQILASNTNNLNSIGASFALAPGGTGASGSASAQIITTEVEASIGNSAQVTTNSSLQIDAHDNTNVLGIGGAAAGGKTAGVGLSAAVSSVDRSVKAYIGDNAVVSAKGFGNGIVDPQGNTFTGNGIIIDATTVDKRLLFAAGVAGGGTAAVAASAVVNIIKGAGTQAFIGKGAKINLDYAAAVVAQLLLLRADHTTDMLSIAGSFGGAKTAGIGAAANVSDVNKNVKAYIDSTATTPTTVNSNNNIIINATSKDNILAIAAGIGAAGTVGIAGSVVVLNRKTNTEAFINDNSNVLAEGNISLAADHDANLKTIAGAGGFGGTGGVGISNSTIVNTDITKAYLGKNVRLSANSNRPAIAILTGQRDATGKAVTANFTGLSITATSRTDSLPIAVGGAGAGTVGVAGSATVNILNETTLAYIDQGAVINAAVNGVRPKGGVNIFAKDETKLISAAGGLAGGGSVGIGAGADVGVITKNTQAYIVGSADRSPAANVYANDNLTLQALSVEDILSVSGAAGIGGSVGLAGAAGVYTLNAMTRAVVGDNVTATARSNMLIAADDQTRLNAIIGTVAIGGTAASVGAAAGVPVVNKTTEALVGKNAIVDALAVAAPGFESIDAKTGTYTESYSAESNAAGNIKAPAMDANKSDLKDPTLVQQRLATANTRKVRGLAITATSQESIETLAVGGSGSAVAGVQVAATVSPSTINTNAYIDNNAKINSSGGTNLQEVLVAAGGDFYHLGVAGGVAIAGVVAATPGVDVTVLKHNTKAYIGTGAEVFAKKDVQVTANATENIVSFAASLAGSGALAAAGAVSVVSIDNQTYAYIGNGAKVDANGNVLVAAKNDTKTTGVAGSAGLGLGAAGIGASVGVTVINKDTQAYLGQFANVRAGGGSDTTLSGIGNSATTVKPINGLAVQAKSSENVFNVSVAGAGGLYAGVAGAVSVEMITSKTKAFAADSANVSAQNINIGVINDARIRAIDGSVAGSLGGALSGGVDIGIIKNDTSAYIGNGATIFAAQDVDVNAFGTKNVDSLAVSAAGALVGVAGAVSVYGIGANLDGTARDSLVTQDKDANSNPQYANVGSFVDAQIAPTNVNTLLGNYSSQEANSVGSAIAPAKTQVQNSSQSGKVSTAVNNTTNTTSTSNITTVVPIGTAAFIGTANVTTGRDVNVNAKDTVEFKVNVGGIAGGAVGVGGAVAVANINNTTKAFINSPVVNVGGNIQINASLDTPNQGIRGEAFAGSAGLVALGARVVILNDNSTQEAYLGKGVNILRAQDVNITATTANRILDAKATGGAVAGVAAGSSIARATVSGSTRAYLDDNVRINPVSALQPIRNLNITANANNRVTADSKAVEAGVVGAVLGSEATATITLGTPGNPATVNTQRTFSNQPGVDVHIGKGSVVNVSNDVLLAANSNEQATATATGTTVGFVATIGASKATATISPVVFGYIDNDAKVTSGRDVKVSGNTNGLGITNATASSGSLTFSSNDRATATSNGLPEVLTFLGNNASIQAGRNVDLASITNIPLNANATSSNVSIVTSNGAVATAKADPVARTIIGSSAKINAGNNISLSNGSTSNHPTTGKVTAQSNGATGDASYAIAGSNNIVNTRIENNANLVAQGDLSVNSYSYMNTVSSATGRSLTSSERIQGFNSNWSNNKVSIGDATINVGRDTTINALNELSFSNIGAKKTDSVQNVATVESSRNMNLTTGNLYVTAKSLPSSYPFGKTDPILPDDTINFNGNVFLTGAKQTRTLTIRSDGTFEPNSNITARIVGNDVVVDDITVPGQKPVAKFDVAGGLLTGLTFIEADPVRLSDVTITNQSTRNLVINRVNLLATTPAEAVTTQYVFKTARTFGSPTNGGNSYDVRLTRLLPVNARLAISNTSSASNITFNQAINAEAGEITVFNQAGAIRANNANVALTAGKFNLTAANAEIGSATTRLQLNLVPSNFRPVNPPLAANVDTADLNVTARGSLFLNIKGLPFYSATPLTPERNKVDQYNINLTSAGGNVDAVLSTDERQLINSQTYINATANTGNINLDARGTTNLYLRDVKAPNGTVTIQGNNLLDANPNGAALTAKVAQLGISKFRGIGTAANPLKTQVGTIERIDSLNGVWINNRGNLILKDALVENGMSLFTTGSLAVGDTQLRAILAFQGLIKLTSGGGGFKNTGVIVNNNGDITITALDTPNSDNFGDNIEVGRRITATNGTLTLQAGDAIFVEALVQGKNVIQRDYQKQTTA